MIQTHLCEQCGEPLTRTVRIEMTRAARPARWRWDCPRDGSWATWTDTNVLFAACWFLTEQQPADPPDSLGLADA